MKYFVKMTPLEPYSFGNEQNFEYPGDNKTGKESYYVCSNNMPEQTTVLGMIRYLVLQNEGILKTSFNYTKEEREQMKKCIGTDSFSFQREEKQDFGFIKNISSIFIVNSADEILIRNPFNNTSKEQGYTPMIMEDNVETSAGAIALPCKGEYDTKKGVKKGFINLATKEILSDDKLFETHIITGNRKSKINGSDEDGFFKREIKTLKDSYSFAVYVEAERLPAKAIGYMGKKKSSFLVEATEGTDTELEPRVENCFKEADGNWYYALSDVILRETPVYVDFCIVEEKYQRNLETIYSEEKYIKKTRKSPVRFSLIQSGSVFYKKCDLYVENENYKQVGYNRIVRLGGEK